MARRYLVSFVLAIVAASAVQSAPALELSGGVAPASSSAPVSMQAFLQRIRQPVAAAPAASPAGGYVPRTAHDNSPYRFDMTQNGRRMTAEEFDAWMKARQAQVAKR